MYNKAIENATVTLAETMANIRAGAVSETKSLNSVDSVENVAYNAQVGGKENGTGLQETSGRTVPGNAGKESQTGTDGTVPESSGSVVHSELAQDVSGVERREDRRELGTLVKKENGTGLQETSGRTVPGNAGKESQAGTDGTISGSVVANVYPELAQEVSGDNGRGNNRYPGELVKTE